MSTVRTQAGRTLLANEGVLPLFIGAMAEDDHVLLDYVLAIEAQTRAAAFGEVDKALSAALYDNPRLISDGDVLFDEIIATLDAVLAELREEAP